ncbi:MAG TPA: hypothetical protein VMU68_09610 [Acidimicrobiales bacterium]|nr:hypothetical protein [Acidimicrobiales bacterium]
MGSEVEWHVSCYQQSRPHVMANMSHDGFDVVIDHCIIDPTEREQAQNLLIGALWVGVMCDVEELIRRESVHGDRYVGFASGTSAVVHQGMNYDMVLDTTSTPSEELAQSICDAILHR